LDALSGPIVNLCAPKLALSRTACVRALQRWTLRSLRADSADVWCLVSSRAETHSPTAPSLQLAERHCRKQRI